MEWDLDWDTLLETDFLGGVQEPVKHAVADNTLLDKMNMDWTVDAEQENSPPEPKDIPSYAEEWLECSPSGNLVAFAQHVQLRHEVSLHVLKSPAEEACSISALKQSLYTLPLFFDLPRKLDGTKERIKTQALYFPFHAYHSSTRLRFVRWHDLGQHLILVDVKGDASFWSQMGAENAWKLVRVRSFQQSVLESTWLTHRTIYAMTSPMFPFWSHKEPQGLDMEKPASILILEDGCLVIVTGPDFDEDYRIKLSSTPNDVWRNASVLHLTECLLVTMESKSSKLAKFRITFSKEKKLLSAEELATVDLSKYTSHIELSVQIWETFEHLAFDLEKRILVVAALSPNLQTLNVFLFQLDAREPSKRAEWIYKSKCQMTLKEGIKPVAINYCPEAPLNQSSGSSRVGSLEAVTVSFSDGRIIYYSISDLRQLDETFIGNITLKHSCTGPFCGSYYMVLKACQQIEKESSMVFSPLLRTQYSLHSLPDHLSPILAGALLNQAAYDGILWQLNICLYGLDELQIVSILENIMIRTLLIYCSSLSPSTNSSAMPIVYVSKCIWAIVNDKSSHSSAIVNLSSHGKNILRLWRKVKRLSKREICFESLNLILKLFRALELLIACFDSKTAYKLLLVVNQKKVTTMEINKAIQKDLGLKVNHIFPAFEAASFVTRTVLGLLQGVFNDICTEQIEHRDYGEQTKRVSPKVLFFASVDNAKLLLSCISLIQAFKHAINSVDISQMSDVQVVLVEFVAGQLNSFQVENLMNLVIRILSHLGSYDKFSSTLTLPSADPQFVNNPKVSALDDVITAQHILSINLLLFGRVALESDCENWMSTLSHLVKHGNNAQLSQVLLQLSKRLQSIVEDDIAPLLMSCGTSEKVLTFCAKRLGKSLTTLDTQFQLNLNVSMPSFHQTDVMRLWQPLISSNLFTWDNESETADWWIYRQRKNELDHLEVARTWIRKNINIEVYDSVTLGKLTKASSHFEMCSVCYSLTATVDQRLQKPYMWHNYNDSTKCICGGSWQRV